MSPPPPAPAVVVAGGLVWNYARSQRNRRRVHRKRTISRWICANKKIAVPVAVGGGSWVAWHWWRYVLDDVPTAL